MFAALRSSAVQRRALGSAKSAFGAVARRTFTRPSQVSAIHARQIAPRAVIHTSKWSRGYATTGEAPQSSQSDPKVPVDDAPWIDVLESTAEGPWLTSVPQEEVERLQISHALLMQVVMYLQRGMQLNAHDNGEQGEDQGLQYLALFQTLPLSNPTAELARARQAISLVAHSVVLQVLSIPPTSDLRQQEKNKDIFNRAKAIWDLNEKYKDQFKRDPTGKIILTDFHLNRPADSEMPLAESPRELAPADKSTPPWSEYWGELQPRLIALLEELDKTGYDLSANQSPPPPPAQ